MDVQQQLIELIKTHNTDSEVDGERVIALIAEIVLSPPYPLNPSLFLYLKKIENREIIIKLLEELPKVFFQAYQYETYPEFINVCHLIDEIHSAIAIAYCRLCAKHNELIYTEEIFKNFIRKDYLMKYWDTEKKELWANENTELNDI